MSAHPGTPWLGRDELALLDRIASDVVLMENAGRGAAEAVLKMLADARARYVASGSAGAPLVVLLSGSGNNGGDACVVARHLANAKVAVEVVATRTLDELRGDAAVMRRAIERMEIPVHVMRADGASADGSGFRAIERATLLVDGLLGTGFRGTMRAEIADLVRAVNARRSSGKARTIALDLPSGLDADTGCPAVPTIEADATVTFAARKKGFEAREALAHLGQVVVVSIGAPEAILQRILSQRGTT